MRAAAGASPNAFLLALARRREPLVGLFVALGDPTVAELLACAGFDFVVLDGEHGANDSRSLLVQLQATTGCPAATLVRPWNTETSVLKRICDIGAQTILAPMIDTADDAARVVAGVRYPPAGVRGVASARAARWTHHPGYHRWANEQIGVVAQIETATALDKIEAIAAVDGIGALFVGPSDLAASLGHLGEPDHPEVRHAANDAVKRITATGKPAGVFAANPNSVREYVASGARFVAVGVDTALLAGAARAAAALLD